MRYLDCPEGFWHDLIGESPPCLSREIHRAAFAILWMGYAEKEKDSLALWLILTHPTKRLYDDSIAHLLCSNYWVQPIYQELPQGLVKRIDPAIAWPISAHPQPSKKLKPAASGARFTDWIGGICYADTLQVWFSAHWAPVVLH